MSKLEAPGEARNRLFTERHAILQKSLIKIEDETTARDVKKGLTPGNLAHRRARAFWWMRETLLHLGYVETVKVFEDYETRGAEH